MASTTHPIAIPLLTRSTRNTAAHRGPADLAGERPVVGHDLVGCASAQALVQLLPEAPHEQQAVVDRKPQAEADHGVGAKFDSDSCSLTSRRITNDPSTLTPPTAAGASAATPRKISHAIASSGTPAARRTRGRWSPRADLLAGDIRSAEQNAAAPVERRRDRRDHRAGVRRRAQRDGDQRRASVARDERQHAPATTLPRPLQASPGHTRRRPRRASA